MYLIVRFLHIACAVVFAGGLVARQLSRAMANKAEDPHSIWLVFQATDPIERLMVIPGSVLVLVFGVIIALMTGAPIFGFLQGASKNWLLVSNLLILLIMALIPLVFVPRGKVFQRNLEEAMRRGEMTPELQASIHDPVVRLSHLVEMVVTILVVMLMVFKPF